jgi:hypothetical protein
MLRWGNAEADALWAPRECEEYEDLATAIHRAKPE